VRVRISYGADIEEVPEEIGQLFTYVSSKARAALRQVEKIEELIDEEDLELASPIIEKLRLTLADTDSRLNDIESIVGGYLNYKENEGAENATEGRPSVDTTTNGPFDKRATHPTSDQDSPEA
jgi:hypothetical protein